MDSKSKRPPRDWASLTNEQATFGSPTSASSTPSAPSDSYVHNAPSSNVQMDNAPSPEHVPSALIAPIVSANTLQQPLNSEPRSLRQPASLQEHSQQYEDQPRQYNGPRAPQGVPSQQSTLLTDDRGPASVKYGSTSLNAGPYGDRGSSGDNRPYSQPAPPSRRVHGRGTSDSGGEGRSRRHRVVKKKPSYCSRCCIPFLAVLLYLWYMFGQLDIDREPECVLDDNVHPVVENKTLPLTYGLNLIANFEDGIKGIVKVRQQENPDMDQIEIRLNVRVSTTNLASYIRGNFEVDPSGPTVNYRVRIQSDDKKKRERMMKYRCAHAEVVVIYPKMTPHGVGSLTLNSAGCDFTVGKISGIFDSLSVHCTNGKLSVDSALVRNRTTFDVTNGEIIGMLETSGEVKANINNGLVDLGIDSTPRESGWNANNFDVQIESVNGAISLRLAQPFYGHFSLASRAGAAKVTVPEQRDYVQYTDRKWNAATGWISSVGSQHEPMKPLPRIQQVNVNGAIEMTVKG